MIPKLTIFVIFEDSIEKALPVFKPIIFRAQPTPPFNPLLEEYGILKMYCNEYCKFIVILNISDRLILN